MRARWAATGLHLILAGGLMATLAVGVLACGERGERRELDRGDLGVAHGLDGSQSATAQTPPELAEVLVWPEEAGSRPDLEADREDCKRELEGDPQRRYQHPLGQFVFLMQCMEAKGWMVNPEIVPQ